MGPVGRSITRSGVVFEVLEDGLGVVLLADVPVGPDEGAARADALLADDDRVRVEPRVGHGIVREGPVWNSNLQPDFNVRVCDGFDARLPAVLRELDESNRFVQKSAESTSI